MIFWKQKIYLAQKNWTWLNGNGPKRGILTLLEAMAHPVYCTIHISVVYSCAHAYHKHLNFKNYQILSKKCQNFKKIMKFHTNNEILEKFQSKLFGFKIRIFLKILLKIIFFWIPKIHLIHPCFELIPQTDEISKFWKYWSFQFQNSAFFGNLPYAYAYIQKNVFY